MLRILACMSMLVLVAAAVFAGDPKEKSAAPSREVQPKAEAARISDLVTIAGAAPKTLSEKARHSLDKIDDKAKVVPLLRVLARAPERLRLYAVTELTRIADSRAFPALLHRSFADRSRRVRDVALSGAKAIDPDRAIRYYVHRFEAHGGGAHRSSIQFGTQLSFVQDYDVEVSATAFIADPIVGVLQEGQVLDVKVVATSRSGMQVTRHALHRALRTLTGATTVPNRRGAWAEWQKKREARSD